MYRVRVLIKFYSRAYGKILHPGETADFTEEELNNIKAVNINMVEVLEKYTPIPEVEAPKEEKVTQPTIPDVDPPKPDDEPIPEVEAPKEEKVTQPTIPDVDPPKPDDEPIPEVEAPKEEENVPPSIPDAEPPKTRKGRKRNQ